MLAKQWWLAAIVCGLAPIAAEAGGGGAAVELRGESAAEVHNRYPLPRFYLPAATRPTLLRLPDLEIEAAFDEVAISALAEEESAAEPEPAPVGASPTNFAQVDPARILPPQVEVKPLPDPDPLSEPGFFDSSSDFAEFAPQSWSVEIGAVMLRELDTPASNLLRDAGGQGLLQASDLELGLAAGPRIAAAYHAAGGLDLELIYFHVDGLHSQQSLAAPALLPLDFSTEAAVSDASFQYGAQLHSYELNVREWLTPNFACVAGLRSLRYQEELTLGGDAGGLAARSVDVANTLYGVQVGAEGLLWRAGGLSLEASAKAGLCLAEGRQRSYLEMAGASGAVQADATQAAFVGEAELTAAYDITPNWSVFAGGQLLWLSGVARGPEQIGQADFAAGWADVNQNGEALFAGLTVGVRGSW